MDLESLLKVSLFLCVLGNDLLTSTGANSNLSGTFKRFLHTCLLGRTRVLGLGISLFQKNAYGKFKRER